MDCLEAFTASELVEGVRCDQCNKTGLRARKRTRFARYPSALVLHINRRVSQIEVNASFVEFPVHLDLCRTSLSHYPGRRYALQAVMVASHHGRAGGHFTVFRRGIPPDHDAWYDISDDLVRKCTLQSVLSSRAYMLLYEQCCA